MISSVFATVVSAGFSMITCLPASSASMAISPCRPVGVQTDTTSMSTACSASVSEVNAVPPCSAASFSARSRWRSTTATRSIWSASSLITAPWMVPITPAPTSASRIRWSDSTAVLMRTGSLRW